MLIHNTLSDLSIYFISLFTISRIVRLRLEKIQKNFFREEELCESCFMKWSTIYKVRVKRGLGVHSLSLLNKTLFCKWY